MLVVVREQIEQIKLVLSEPVEPVHQIELNYLKLFVSPVRTNPQITLVINLINVSDTPSNSK